MFIKKKNKVNNGSDFEEQVYNRICETLNTAEKYIGLFNIAVFRKKGYFSRDRNKNIITDISIEIYMNNLKMDNNMYPVIIVIIECKDYSKALPVDDVEEFHAKLQQIGADNTKGVIITRNPLWQESTLNFARSKGIMIKEFGSSDCICYEEIPCGDYKNIKTYGYIIYSGKKYVIQNKDFFIGRSSDNDLIISNMCVSRKHCMIHIEENKKCVIYDCNSRYGTFVNGFRVTSEQLLYSGDIILLADEKLEINIT